ncbi:degenerin deg-1 isoform X2 [Nematostella vectensis]|uniref:degenerin deg-1 isoform X2 n=1 Tax=Nematostella vectensis TaxID=45351 RepID=UPI00207753F5|nr:degenerin deg-1 isoform X2 [Nematostella vectensis]
MSQNEEKCRQTVSGLIWDFFGQTTAHGFGRIANTKSRLRRMFWVCLVMAAFGMFSLQIYDLLMIYLSRPIGTQIWMKHAPSIAFPAVTLCNFNIVRRSQITSELAGSFENFITPNISDVDDARSLRKRRQSVDGCSCGCYLKCRNFHDPHRNTPEPATTCAPVPTTIPTTATTTEPTTVPTTIPTTIPTTLPTTEPTTAPTTPEPTTLEPTDPPTTEAPTTLPPGVTPAPTEKPLTIEEKKEQAFTGEVSQPDPATLDKQTLKTEELVLSLATKPEDMLMEVGHQFNDMVLSCTYRGIPCTNYTENLWSRFWHYRYGNCYVFNSGKDWQGEPKPILRSNKPGPASGLTLELNAEQHEYVGQLSHEAGMRVLISTQGEMPSPLEKGISVSPGFSTTTGIRLTNILRADPFNNKSCLSSDDIDPENLYRKRYNVSYSRTTCMDSCLAHKQVDMCGCLEYRFPNIDNRIVCDILDIDVIRCLNKVQSLYQDNKLGCSEKCRPPCNEEVFKLSISSARWPTDDYEAHFLDELKEEKGFVLPANADARAYFVKLQIFYEELNHEVIEEYRSYELVNFVSDIGGQLGLWIGISALTASEFIELLIVIALHLLRKVTRIGLINNSAEQPADTNPCYLDDITLTGDLKERRGALTESNTSLTVRYLAEVARKRNKKGQKEKREASWHIDEEAFPCYRDQATIHPNVESNTSLSVRYLDDIVQKKSKQKKRSKGDTSMVQKGDGHRGDLSVRRGELTESSGSLTVRYLAEVASKRKR